MASGPWVVAEQWECDAGDDVKRWAVGYWITPKSEGSEFVTILTRPGTPNGLAWALKWSVYLNGGPTQGGRVARVVDGRVHLAQSGEGLPHRVKRKRSRAFEERDEDDADAQADTQAREELAQQIARARAEEDGHWEELISLKKTLEEQVKNLKGSL